MDTIITEYYKKNKDTLMEIFHTNEGSIDGRICHPSIIILNILSNIITINNYLEIGVHNGGSMSMLLASHQAVNMYGIDLFEDMYDIDKHLNAEKFVTYQYFRRDNLSNHKTTLNLNKLKETYKNNSTINLIQGNSYFDDTEEKFKHAIGGDKLDLLFIDGDHTLDGVKNDYLRYSKFVRDGGYIIFDDYHHAVIKEYVDEILENDKSLELIYKFKCEATPAIDVLIRKNTGSI